MDQFFKKIMMIFTVTMVCSHNLDAASSTLTAEVDVMDMPGIFKRINMAKVPEFCAAIALISELSGNPVSRFFHLLRFQKERTLEFCSTLCEIDELGSLSARRFMRLIPPEDLPDMMKNQLVYHLAMLTAIAPTITRDLIEGCYSWVLDSDKLVSDHPIADFLYDFFAKPENTEIRQKIWDAMRSSGLIESDIANVKDSFYNCGESLMLLLEISTEPVDIVIGGNSIPTYYKDVDPKCSGQYSHQAVTAFGSSGYCHSYQQGCITVGVDHRHRPRVLANAYNPLLWRDLPWERIKQIRCDYLSLDKLRVVVPAAMHEKLVSLNDYH